jgi:hypothetical protein
LMVTTTAFLCWAFSACAATTVIMFSIDLVPIPVHHFLMVCSHISPIDIQKITHLSHGIRRMCAIYSVHSLALYPRIMHARWLPAILTSTTTTFSLSRSITRDQPSCQYCTKSSTTITHVLMVPFFHDYNHQPIHSSYASCAKSPLLDHITTTSLILVINLDSSPWVSHDHVILLLSSHQHVSTLLHQAYHLHPLKCDLFPWICLCSLHSCQWHVHFMYKSVIIYISTCFVNLSN